MSPVTSSAPSDVRPQCASTESVDSTLDAGLEQLQAEVINVGGAENVINVTDVLVGKRCLPWVVIMTSRGCSTPTVLAGAAVDPLISGSPSAAASERACGSVPTISPAPRRIGSPAASMFPVPRRHLQDCRAMLPALHFHSRLAGTEEGVDSRGGQLAARLDDMDRRLHELAVLSKLEAGAAVFGAPATQVATEHILARPSPWLLSPINDQVSDTCAWQQSRCVIMCSVGTDARDDPLMRRRSRGSVSRRDQSCRPRTLNGSCRHNWLHRRAR